jgi:ligand-binding sensor domain-containing protein/tRNA A-37 threonylcarbamoyl transferase component Bud32
LRKVVFVAILFIFFAGSLWSLDPQKKITQYVLNTWKTERGLPNNIVIAIVQDRSGYLWLGTAEGLVRFDGENFKAFNSNDSTEFRNQLISSLYADDRGVLWIGTMRGKLFSLEQGKFKSHFLAGDISGIAACCIAEDDHGILWVGTSKGLFYRPAEGNGIFGKHSTFPGIGIKCLAKDRSGGLLVGTKDKGLYSLKKEQWHRVLSDTDKLGGDIQILRQGRNGYLLIGTENGLYGYHENQLFAFSSEKGSSSSMIALVEDRDNNMWVGSENGLFRWQNVDSQALPKNGLMAGVCFYSLYEDAENSLWAGSLDGGLVQIRDEKITAVTNSEGLNGSKFRCLHEDAAGALLIGGYGSHLNRYQNGNCENIAFPTRFENNNIYSLEQDGDNSFWLGTSFGLFNHRDGRLRNIPLPGANPNIETRCVLRDRSGCLWIGTWGAGLLCRQGEKIITYSSADGLPGDRIASIFQDRRGDLWIGCENGLAVMTPKNSGKFVVEQFLDNHYVVSFYEDKLGIVWIGTHQGLKVCREGHWGSLNSDRGLFDSRVYVILEDDLGYLWMSSERGIFRARKDELEKAAFETDLKVNGRLFDENDGMKSRICNYGNPAGWKDRHGRLWFANLAGAVSVDPAHILKNEKEPPVLVEEVLVDQKNFLAPDLDLSHEVKLPAGSQKFEFHYTALSFIRSEKIECKYTLEGYDSDWTSAGNRREAFYNDLRPGHYRFRVVAANADGVWNMAGASFAFFLRPFIYQTWWFMVLAVLTFAVLSALSWQLLKKYLRAVTFWKKKTQIGHFKILETIGSGGMATVYKAQDIFNKKRIVALKVLKEENFHDENQKKRFNHESLITEQLDHPHIVRIIERGETEDCWYIAMELLQGHSLGSLIKEKGRLDVPTALEIMLQIIDALGAIHAQNIVHRDLKPENIMVSGTPGRRYFAKLLDFGLAITPAQSRLTMSGVVMGTIRYLPPERISDGTSSPAGDIYSAGVILYEMLTGSRPFWSEATGEVIQRILKTYPLPPREISAEVPRELNELIMAMIDKEPERRPLLAAIQAEMQRLAEKYPMPA